MSGHHPFHALAAKLTARSEGRAAVDRWRRQLEAVLSLSRPQTAADHTRTEAPAELVPRDPDHE
jgi:hypothetical protein